VSLVEAENLGVDAADGLGWAVFTWLKVTVGHKFYITRLH
jgi:hypothetical protein